MQCLEEFIGKDNPGLLIVTFVKKEFHLTVYKTVDSGSGL
jgi:hypothetical protein